MNIYLLLTAIVLIAVFLVFAPEKWKNIVIGVGVAALAIFLSTSNDNSEQKKENEQLDEKIETEDEEQEQLKEDIEQIDEQMKEGSNEEITVEEADNKLNDIINSDGGSSSDSE